MKKLLIVTCLCLTCLSLTAQPYFNQLYRTDTNTATIFRSIVATDTAWYVTGITLVTEPVPHNAGFFARLSTTGNVEELKIYTDTLRPLEMWDDALMPTNDGHFVVTGRNPIENNSFLAVFDNNGDTLLYTCHNDIYPNSVTRSTQIKEDDQNNYYILAVSGIIYKPDSTRITVIKTDPTGNETNQFDFQSPDPFCIFMTASDIQLLPNNHFIVSATIYGQCPFYYPPDDSCRGRTWIFEADSLGNIVWQYLSPALGRVVMAPKLTLTQDGGIVFSGHETFLVQSGLYIAFNERQYIGKLNSNHQLAWEYTNPNTGPAYFSRSVELADGSILVCGSSIQYMNVAQDTIRKLAYVVKFSANGDSLGHQQYERLTDWIYIGNNIYQDMAEHRFQDMVMLPDSSLVMVGEIIDGWTPSPTAGYWAWVVHTDKYGCVEQEGCFPVGIQEASPLPPPKELIL